MKGYRFDVTCPICGADIRHIADSAPRSWERAAVVRCSACTWQGVVRVEMSTTDPREGTGRGRPTLIRDERGRILSSPRAACGTDRAYQQHVKAGEEPDEACKRAHRVRQQDYAKKVRV